MAKGQDGKAMEVASHRGSAISGSIPSNLYVKVTTLRRSSSTTVSGRGGLTPLAAAPDFQAGGGGNPLRSTSDFGDWLSEKVDLGCRDQSEQIDLEK